MPRSEFKFSFPFRVRYSEVDGQKIVFNAHYLTYFDTAITEYFRALAYDYMGQVDRIGEDFHTVKTLVEYRKPISFDQEIDVLVRTSRMGRSSLTFDLQIYPKGVDDMLASGEVVWVNTDQTTHRSVPVPAELVERLVAFEGEVFRG
jgi:acyl-CoA thioester hydrolase|tara:strand:- start:61 stop:501 length:441 start_codon:yes stop_codon:yes gene_type:complete